MSHWALRFPEPMVGKARLRGWKKIEGPGSSCRAFILFRLVQQLSVDTLVPPSRGWPTGHSRHAATHTLWAHRWAHIGTYPTKLAVTKQVPHDIRCAINDLSCYITVQSHCLQNMGLEDVRTWEQENLIEATVLISPQVGWGRSRMGDSTGETYRIYLWLVIVWQIHRNIVILIKWKLKNKFLKSFA